MTKKYISGYQVLNLIFNDIVKEQPHTFESNDIDQYIKQQSFFNYTAIAVALSDWDEFTATKDLSLVIDPLNGLDDILENATLKATSSCDFEKFPLAVFTIFTLLQLNKKSRHDLAVWQLVDGMTDKAFSQLSKQIGLVTLTTMQSDYNISDYFDFLNMFGIISRLMPKTDKQIQIVSTPKRTAAVLKRRDEWDSLNINIGLVKFTNMFIETDIEVVNILIESFGLPAEFIETFANLHEIIDVIYTNDFNKMNVLKIVNKYGDFSEEHSNAFGLAINLATIFDPKLKPRLRYIRKIYMIKMNMQSKRLAKLSIDALAIPNL